MTLTSIGDLARNLTLQTRSNELKHQIEDLSHELSTWKAKDVSAHLMGDYSHLLDLDRSLTRLDAFDVASAEAELFTDTMQQSLTLFSDSSGEMTASLLAFGTANHAVTHEQASVQARNELDTMMSALNTRIGNRSLFSGIATDVSPLPSVETLLTNLEAELTGLATITDIRNAADAWFNDPAGFDTVIYRGSDTALSSMQIAENERISLSIAATDPALKAAMRDVAIAALVADNALAIPTDQRTGLFKQLGVALANTQDEIVKLQAEVGAAESRVEQAVTRNAAARTSLEYSRNVLIGVDPDETAVKLKTVQSQLESLYTVTVRNAGLSLVNFLR